MAQHFLYSYPDFGGYDFAELPKGAMLQLSMNPYNGKAFVRMGKHATSCRIALDIMRDLVAACGELERSGSVDPLRDLLLKVDGSGWNSLFDAKEGFRAIAGRGAGNGENGASGDYGQVEKAS